MCPYKWNPLSRTCTYRQAVTVLYIQLVRNNVPENSVYFRAFTNNLAEFKIFWIKFTIFNFIF